MEGVKEKAAVKRVLAALHEHGLEGEVHVLSDSARTAQEAATALGIEVGQIASSLIFKLPDESPLLIITSGRHRVDTDLVAKNLGIEKFGRTGEHGGALSFALQATAEGRALIGAEVFHWRYRINLTQ